MVNQGKNDYKFDVDKFWRHYNDRFETFGAVRLEILFYDKADSIERGEHVLLYGVAENSRFQLQSFTLSYSTYWFDDLYHYPEDKYFDSIIINGHGTPQILTGSSSELSICDSQGNIIARCSIVLRFNSEPDEPFSPQTMGLASSLNTIGSL